MLREHARRVTGVTVEPAHAYLCAWRSISAPYKRHLKDTKAARQRHHPSMPPLPPDPSWHHDAIIYQLHVKAFRDSNRDGYGDFRGLLERLDYIAELGVTAIWLLPFYPSPLKDDGYDIADYCGVHPSYGSLDDVVALFDAA